MNKQVDNMDWRVCLCYSRVGSPASLPPSISTTPSSGFLTSGFWLTWANVGHQQEMEGQNNKKGGWYLFPWPSFTRWSLGTSYAPVPTATSPDGRPLHHAHSFLLAPVLASFSCSFRVKLFLKQLPVWLNAGCLTTPGWFS